MEEGLMHFRLPRPAIIVLTVLFTSGALYGCSKKSEQQTVKVDEQITFCQGEQIVFAAHNLVVDNDFGEMHLILCRNVLIYFKPTLKERVLHLFDSCLLPGGFLCLGVKETLDGRKVSSHYAEVVDRTRIYRKNYA